MNNIVRTAKTSVLVCSVAVLTACGGGGGGDDSVNITNLNEEVVDGSSNNVVVSGLRITCQCSRCFLTMTSTSNRPLKSITGTFQNINIPSLDSDVWSPLPGNPLQSTDTYQISTPTGNGCLAYSNGSFCGFAQNIDGQVGGACITARFQY